MKLFIKHNNELKPLGGDTDLTKSDIEKALGYTPSDGNYNNLSNKPTIPTKVSELTNDAPYAKFSEVVPNSRTVAEISLTNNITKQQLFNSIVNMFGTSATLDTGTSHGRIPTIGEDGKLPKSIIPMTDGLIYGGAIERNKSDTEAIITPSDDFLAKYPDEVQGVDITITTETTKYSSVYFVVKNASNVTILGKENCEVGDWIIAQGANGFAKIDNVDAVKSVNDMRGNVVIKPKDLILENYSTSELDDNNIYPTDSAQTGISKLDKRVKELQESTTKKAPDVIFNISSFETLTTTEKALIGEKVKSITNNFNTDLVYESFSDIKLQHTSDETGPTITKTFSLVGYEYIEANKFYYKFTFNLNENTELILTVVDTEEVTIETIKFAKKEEVSAIQNVLDEVETLVDILNGETEVLLDDILGEDI